MPSIELSAGMMSGLPARIIRLSTEVNDQSVPGSGLLPMFNSGNLYDSHSIGHIWIMKGAMPTAATIPPLFATRQADILIDFSQYTQSVYLSNDFSLSNQSVNPAQIHSVYKAAAASGLATWFMLAQRMGNFGGALSGAFVGNTLVGSVGLPGSGADLEIPSVDIVTGMLYRIRGLQLLFPSVWFYGPTNRERRTC